MKNPGLALVDHLDMIRSNVLIRMKHGNLYPLEGLIISRHFKNRYDATNTIDKRTKEFWSRLYR